MALLLNARRKTTRFIPEPTLESALAELDAISTPEPEIIEDVQDDVEDAQPLPAHYGRKGEGPRSTPPSPPATWTPAAPQQRLRQLLMAASGLAASTARKYVQAAAKFNAMILPFPRTKTRKSSRRKTA